MKLHRVNYVNNLDSQGRNYFLHAGITFFFPFLFIYFIFATAVSLSVPYGLAQLIQSGSILVLAHFKTK